MIHHAYMIFISPVRRKRIILFPSDLFLKAVLIFLKLLVSLKPRHQKEELEDVAFVHLVIRSRQLNAHCSTPLPLALLGPRSEEDCLKRNNILLAFSSPLSPAKCSGGCKALLLTCSVPDCKARTTTTISCRQIFSVWLDKKTYVLSKEIK